MSAPSGGSAARRRDAARSGYAGDEAAARAYLDDSSAPVRATALGSLARMGAVSESDACRGLADPDSAVRRRACQVAARLPGRAEAELIARLDDADPTVVEVAAWALGERGPSGTEVIERLSSIVRAHDEPLCREAAVAALGAIGDRAGLPAILAATADRATVRRRAIIALAPFSGAEVGAALARALDDKDWQVRQAAEDLS